MGLDWLQSFREKKERVPNTNWETHDPLLKIKACLTHQDVDQLDDVVQHQKKPHQVAWPDGALTSVHILSKREEPIYSTGFQTCIGWAITAKETSGVRKILFAHALAGNYETRKGARGYWDARKIKNSIESFLRNAEPHTVDAVMFGGAYPLGNTPEDMKTRHVYKDAINSLGKILASHINFEPTIIAGPQVCETIDAILDEGVDVVFKFAEDGQARLWIIRKRPFNQEMRPFVASDVQSSLEELDTQVESRIKPEHTV